MTTVGTHTVDDAGALRRDPAIAPLGFGGLGDRRFWRSTTLLLSSFPIGVFWFVFLVSALSTGVALSFTFVGVPLLALAMVFWRHGAQAERWRLRTLVGADVPTPYRLVTEGRWWQRMRARAQDPATWRDLVYLLALFPIGSVSAG